MNDSACRATVNCQYNCYSTLDGGAADTCAAACAGTTAAKFTAYNNCQSNNAPCATGTTPPCSCP
jgi:hypothetical protein